jgi:hypothetical protein
MVLVADLVYLAVGPRRLGARPTAQTVGGRGLTMKEQGMERDGMAHHVASASGSPGSPPPAHQAAGPCEAERRAFGSELRTAGPRLARALKRPR